MSWSCWCNYLEPSISTVDTAQLFGIKQSSRTYAHAALYLYRALKRYMNISRKEQFRFDSLAPYYWHIYKGSFIAMEALPRYSNCFCSVPSRLCTKQPTAEPLQVWEWHQSLVKPEIWSSCQKYLCSWKEWTCQFMVAFGDAQHGVLLHKLRLLQQLNPQI